MTDSGLDTEIFTHNFLGELISEDPSWSVNTSATAKKSRQRHFLRVLRMVLCPSTAGPYSVLVIYSISKDGRPPAVPGRCLWQVDPTRQLTEPWNHRQKVQKQFLSLFHQTHKSDLSCSVSDATQQILLCILYSDNKDWIELNQLWSQIHTLTVSLSSSGLISALSKASSWPSILPTLCSPQTARTSQLLHLDWWCLLLLILCRGQSDGGARWSH